MGAGGLGPAPPGMGCDPEAKGPPRTCLHAQAPRQLSWARPPPSPTSTSHVSDGGGALGEALGGAGQRF